MSEKTEKNLFQKRYGILEQETKISTQFVLENIFFKVQSVHTIEAVYNARSWDKQKANRYILSLNKKQSIEAMTILHYSGDSIRDLTVEISNMFGCPVGCGFCASKDIKNTGKLSAISYLKQVNTCLKYENISVNEMPDFQVSFAGIGEPSLVAKEILNGGKLIAKIYPSVRFNIATCGINLEAFKTWESDKFQLRTLQIPFYHYDTTALKKLFKKYHFPNLINVLESALYLASFNDECRVKINYLLIRNFNDKVQDIDHFLQIIEPYKQSLTIKLSFLNPTIASKKIGLHSPPKAVFQDLFSHITSKGYSCYVFGTAFDTHVGCGQLASQTIVR